MREILGHWRSGNTQKGVPRMNKMVESFYSQEFHGLTCETYR